jgi:hypothetical protein
LHTLQILCAEATPMLSVGKKVSAGKLPQLPFAIHDTLILAPKRGRGELDWFAALRRY